MKYLIKFNEKNESSFSSDLEEDCYTNLAYLLDGNFSVGYRNVNHNSIETPYINVVIKSTNRYPNNNIMPFYWKDVSDYIIPFIHFINKKYCIIQKTSYFGSGIMTIETQSSEKIRITTFDVEAPNNLHNISLGDIQSNNIKPNTLIKYLEISVAGYRYIPK
jgi:hypothetical protein